MSNNYGQVAQTPPRNLSLARGATSDGASADGMTRGKATNGAINSKPRCRNAILNALPADTWRRLEEHFRRVLLHQGAVLQENGSDVRHIYFIESGMVSMVMESQNDVQVEVGVVGTEGAVSVIPAMVSQPSIQRAVVQVPGNALCLPAPVLREECRRGGELHTLLQHYSYLFLAQASQCALCNRVHTVEERLSRWLLTTRDRIHSDDLELTHEFIAHMLGVRRSGVTIALGVLQQSGLIDISRGHISLKDPVKLQSCACECYDVVCGQFQSFAARTAG